MISFRIRSQNPVTLWQTMGLFCNRLERKRIVTKTRGTRRLNRMPHFVCVGRCHNAVNRCNGFRKDSALEYDISSMPNGMDTIVGENGNKISGGQKQRIAIARALIYNRSILLIDEGTSALDEKNAERIEKCLLENPRLTLILVSHHLTEARKRQFDEVYKLDTP